MASRTDPEVEFRGVRDLRRDLHKFVPEIDKELGRSLRKIGGPVLATARELAPNRTGEFARSLRLSVTRGGISIVSTHPAAGVLHWGGTIEPRGVPITFPRNEFAVRAAAAHADRLVEDVGDGIEKVLRQVGRSS